MGRVGSKPRRGEKKRGGEYSLKCNDVVTRLHVGDALTNGLNNTGTLVSQDDGEGTFWVLSR